MMAAMGLFSLMGVFIKLAAETLHVFQIVFFRNAFAILILTPIVMRIGASSLDTPRLGLHALRAGIGFCAMTAGFASVTMISLAEATALNFTAPLFATLGAVLFLGERIGAHRSGALAVGFLGAAYVLQLGAAPVSLGAALALLSAFLIAVSTLIVKRLTSTDRPEAIALWMVVLQTPAAALPASMVWTWPSIDVVLWLFCLAGAGSAAHLCWTRAMSLAQISQLQPLEFTKLPISALLGFVIFLETPTLETFLGGAAIMAATVYITQREIRLGRRRPSEPAASALDPTGAAEAAPKRP